MSEILVVPSLHVPETIQKQEFIRIDRKNLDSLLTSGSFKSRPVMEHDVHFKQIIPYIYVKNTNNQILVYRRSAKGDEDRLHHLLSIGIGGHIEKNDPDHALQDLEFKKSNPSTITIKFYNSLMNELHEEIGIVPNLRDVKIVGAINENSTDVGKVHLGIVCSFSLQKKVDINKGEIDILIEREFMSMDAIRKKYDEMESWSQILLDHMNELDEE